MPARKKTGKPVGRPTDEEAARIFEQEKAEMRERMAKRYAEKKRALGQKAGTRNQGNLTAKKPRKDSRSVQLNRALRQIIDRLIDESQKGGIEDVDWRDPESVKRRKAQLTNIKDLLVIISQMKNVISEVKDNEADETNGAAISAKNVSLLEDARKLLAQKGVKVDL